MTRAIPYSLVLIGMMTAIAYPALAQQTPDAAKPAAAASDSAASTATAPPAEKKPSAKAPSDLPSEDTLKKAREAGYHTKVKRGIVYYCKSVVETGTRFTSESCVDENQLAQILIAEQAQRDQFSNHACGGGCSGK